MLTYVGVFVCVIRFPTTAEFGQNSSTFSVFVGNKLPNARKERYGNFYFRTGSKCQKR